MTPAPPELCVEDPSTSSFHPLSSLSAVSSMAISARKLDIAGALIAVLGLVRTGSDQKIGPFTGSSKLKDWRCIRTKVTRRRPFFIYLVVVLPAAPVSSFFVVLVCIPRLGVIQRSTTTSIFLPKFFQRYDFIQFCSVSESSLVSSSSLAV
ncbi:hypothetical protein PIB30_032441 [Stylosanthes scabra]|uniref:Uncharacterized protein n=1 Tax=Stylosanthes scabra TaxID=79078 RepID=A0ABU6QBP4_9FABA|nr:hypothetical protein [Stylosanthes scabra]